LDSNTTFISKDGLQRFYARIYEIFANKSHTHTDIQESIQSLSDHIENTFGIDIGDGLAVSPTKRLVIDTNYLGDYISEQFVPGVVTPTYNSKTGQYTGVAEWLVSTLEEDTHKDEIYTTRIPKWSTSHDVVCTKTNDNAGLSVTPATENDAGSDAYKDLPAFKIWEVNGGYNSYGIPYVTAFKGRDS
jgi:hypothetical protein